MRTTQHALAAAAPGQPEGGDAGGSGLVNSGREDAAPAGSPEEAAAVVHEEVRRWMDGSSPPAGAAASCDSLPTVLPFPPHTSDSQRGFEGTGGVMLDVSHSQPQPYHGGWQAGCSHRLPAMMSQWHCACMPAVLLSWRCRVPWADTCLPHLSFPCCSLVPLPDVSLLSMHDSLLLEQARAWAGGKRWAAVLCGSRQSQAAARELAQLHDPTRVGARAHQQSSEL